MDLKIEGKIAVVAAASQGLGRAVAEALAAEGAKLAICSRDEEHINTTAKEIREKYNVEVFAGVCDVTEKESIEAFKEKVINHYGTCHILFTNAGGPPPGKVEDFDSDDYKKALDLNLFSTINLVFAFLPFMKKQKWGRILACCSVTVRQPIATLALSNVSRVGVVAFLKSLSKEVGSYGITANVLAPGYIMTERVIQLLKDTAKRENISFDQAKANAEASVPVKKITGPEDFGALAAFLSSQYASYITGETILIDGGMYNGLV